MGGPLRTRGLHDHRQPDGAEQIEEVREVPGITRRATFTLNELAQQEGQETDKRVHAHLLICPMILRADRQVVHVFELAEGRLCLALPCLPRSTKRVDPVMSSRFPNTSVSRKAMAS